MKTINKETMPVGTRVMFWDGSCGGETMEPVCDVIDSSKKVVRIRWADSSETIEDVDNIIITE